MRHYLFLIPALLLLGGMLYANPAPASKSPSRRDLLATVDHISQLAKQQKVELESTLKSLDAATIENGKLQTKVDSQTIRLNNTIDALNAAEKSLWWYRLHWWGMWIVFGLGVLACGFVAFLKFTGRLAGVAAVVASKVPI